MATANYLTHLKTGKYNSVLIEDLYHSMTQNASNWGLATGQRLKVWTSDDIIRLLDSIIRGYPIGTIILGSGPSLSLQDRHFDAKGDQWVIYDGQQRCLAIRDSISPKGFTIRPEYGLPEGENCSVFADLNHISIRSEEKDSSVSITRKLSCKPSLCFHRAADEEGCFPFEVFPKAWEQESGSSVVFKNALRDKKRRYEGRNKAFWFPLWKIMYADDIEVPKDYCELARAIKQRIFAYNLSIYLLDTYSHEETHNIFIRVNRAGVPLNATEIFFAGVKKDWPTAEQDMDDLYGKGHILTLHGLVNLIARVAYVEYQRDVGREKSLETTPFFKMELKSLNDDLWRRMQESIEDNKPLRTAIVHVDGYLQQRLGMAVKLVNQTILGNAIIPYYLWQKSGNPLPKEPSQAMSLLLFLISTSNVLSHWRTFPSAMFKDAWKEAENVGISSEWKSNLNSYLIELNKSNNKHVKPYLPHDSIKDERRALPISIYSQLGYLSMFQSVPFKESVSSVHNDHLIAYTYARKNYNAAGESKERFMRIINGIGNKWLIKSSENQSFSDDPPSKKFKDIEKLKNSDTLRGQRPFDEVLSPAYIEHLKKIEDMITKKRNITIEDEKVFNQRKYEIMMYVLHSHFNIHDIVSEDAIMKA